MFAWITDVFGMFMKTRQLSPPEETMELQWIETILKMHKKEKSIARVLSIKCEPAVQKGNNYFSEILRAKLLVVLESGKTAKKSIIIKRMPNSDVQRKLIEKYSMFKLEIDMYNHNLLQMEIIMDDYNDTEEKLWCDMYGHRCNDLLVLEDLRVLNYSVTDRLKMMDMKHTLLAVRSLGKFHALSKVLLLKGCASEDLIQAPQLYNYGSLLKLLYAAPLEIMSEIAEVDWGWSSTAQRLKIVVDKVVETMIALNEIDNSRFNVINHGDFWTNNIMFKYDKHKNPVGVKFVDFQMACYNSHAFDLTYFLYTSVRPIIRRNEYMKILEAYHESVVTNLIRYETPKEEIPSLDDVVAEMERLRPYAFYILCCTLPIFISTQSHAIDFTKTDDKETDLKENYNISIFKNPMFVEIIKTDIEHFSNLGVL